MKKYNDLPPLVPNYTTTRIETALDIAAKRRFFTLIFGQTGRGKTLTAEYWARKRNDAVFVGLKSAQNVAGLVRELAEAVLGQDYQSTQKNKSELCQFLQSNERLIIIDEANQLLLSPNPRTIAKSLEFLRRDIYDLTGTPLVLIFTSIKYSEFRHGRMASFMEQFRRRVNYNLEIPSSILTKSDILPIMSAYTDNPSSKLLAAATAIASAGDGKIGTLVKYLDLAKEYIATKGGSITPELLISLQERHEGGGKWPED